MKASIASAWPSSGSLFLRRSQRSKVSVCASAKPVIVVSGASGRTGKLVFKKLKESDEFQPRGLVRSADGWKVVQKECASATADDFIIADIAHDKDRVLRAMQGAQAAIILTSAMPKLRAASLIPVFVDKILRRSPAKRPKFFYPEGGHPRIVDYEGAKAQIDACREAGVSHVILVSSMGGTQKDNMLNTMGEGNILMWKRKAEKYLIGSGLMYTIIHPGGLLDAPGGERTLLIDVDDKLLATNNRSVPRDDVATVCVACLNHANAKNVSFDLASVANDDKVGTGVNVLLQGLAGMTCSYANDNALGVEIE